MQEQADNGRQAHLREAAEVLVEWVHARRATWSTESLAGGELVDFSELAGLVGETATGWSIPDDDPGWSQPVAEPPPVFIAPPPFVPDMSPAPVFAAQPPPVAFDVPAILDTEPSVPDVEPRRQPRVPIAAAIRAFAAPLIPLARRGAPAVAVLAVVVGAGWMAAPYVGKVKTWMAQLTAEAPAPKAEPVVATRAPSRGGAARTGQLTARSDPPGATVLVDGRERGVTPLTLNLTIGSHTVVMQSEKGSVRRTVTVASDRAAVFSETIFAGWLTVFAPFELQITEGSHVIQLDDTGRVLLPPGPHDLLLENRDLGYKETRRVDVEPGQTTSLSLVTTPSTLTVTASSPAVVSVDGKPVGETPLTNQPIALGTRDILVKAADGAERRFTQKVTVAPVQIDVDFSKP